MKLFFLLLLPLFLVLISSNAILGQQAYDQSSVKDWTGEYQYDYTEAANPKQFAPVITYTLTVTENNNELKANFSADGDQTADEYDCTVKVVGNQLNFYFLKNLSQFSVRSDDFRKGDLLATLVKTTAQGKSKYIFKAGKYSIFPPTSKRIVYFKKIR